MWVSLCLVKPQYNSAVYFASPPLFCFFIWKLLFGIAVHFQFLFMESLKLLIPFLMLLGRTDEHWLFVGENNFLVNSFLFINQI